MRKPLEIPSVNVINLRDRIRLGNIPELILHDRLRDGRIIGLLAEDILPYEFSGLTRVPGNGSSCDIIKSDTSQSVRIQCKSFNTDKSRSVDLSPSYMKGKGRKFDLVAFVDYIKQFDAYSLIDVTRFPEMVIYTLPVNVVVDAANTTISSAKLSIATLKRL
jgi:hypothetical protein